jgi:hypothetical protein
MRDLYVLVSRRPYSPDRCANPFHSVSVDSERETSFQGIIFTDSRIVTGRFSTSHSPVWLTVVMNMSLPLPASSSLHWHWPGNPTAVSAFSSILYSQSPTTSSLQVMRKSRQYTSVSSPRRAESAIQCHGLFIPFL